MERYADVADEYYDPNRHPTSAAFRFASRSIVDAWLPSRLGRRGYLCDVGAGDSVLAEVLVSRERSLRRLYLVDSSEHMLRYSKRWIDAGASAVLSEASRLPFPPQTVALLVASLGDPFNDAPFWREVTRVLRPDALLVFTTPAFEWAEQFRIANHEPPDAAEFSLADGRVIRVPSNIYPEREQIRLMRSNGLRVKGIYHFLAGGLPEAPPPKLQGLATTLPIVTGYLCVASA